MNERRDRAPLRGKNANYDCKIPVSNSAEEPLEGRPPSPLPRLPRGRRLAVQGRQEVPPPGAHLLLSIQTTAAVKSEKGVIQSFGAYTVKGW